MLGAPGMGSNAAVKVRCALGSRKRQPEEGVCREAETEGNRRGVEKLRRANFIEIC